MNSNPFEPVSPEPATLQPTDSTPDDFMADNDNLRAKPARPAVMLDGVSPAPGFNQSAPAVASYGPTPVVAETPPAGVAFGGTGYGSPSPLANPVTSTDDSLLGDNDMATNDDFLNSAPDPSANQPDQLTAAIDALPADEPGDHKKQSKKDKKAAAKAAKASAKNDKPPRQFTISIASIILFLLAAGGIGGTIYYYMQNDANQGKIKTYQAQVAELQNNGASSSDSDNKTSSQFDALQDKITELTKQNEAKQKTLDENKTKIDDLTKKNSDLTKTNDDLTKKVQNISDLTTRVDTMLKKLETIYANQ